MAGTLGGVSVLDDDTVRANYTTANSHLKHNWITALVRVGDEWFAGTYGAGVLRLDPHGEWHSLRRSQGRLRGQPERDGGRAAASVYAGSLDRGLFVFDRATGPLEQHQPWDCPRRTSRRWRRAAAISTPEPTTAWCESRKERSDDPRS